VPAGCQYLRLLLILAASSILSLSSAAQTSAFLGFDRNQYPGDQHLKELRKTFDYTGYWLNNPPGTKGNDWVGKRGKLEAAGFGFLVLFNGRLYSELKTVARAKRLGAADGQAAIAAARREGFPEATIVFLDQEQGGRLLDEQKAYLFAWIDAVSRAGFRPGVYCSGIAAREDDGSTIITANDIRENAAGRSIVYWVSQDGCPPSPGCMIPRNPLPPEKSGIAGADIWQFAQSPQRRDVAAACQGYQADGNCYAPGIGVKLHLDMNTATSPDPSQGRSH